MKLKLCNAKALPLSSILAILICATQVFSNGVNDVYGDDRLHQIEKQIADTAQESTKDISYQEHEKLLLKVADDIVGKITNPSDLATLAIWSNLNVHSDEYAGGFINYNHVIRTARTAAIAGIGKSNDSNAAADLWKVAHQLNLNSKVAEEIEAQFSNLSKKDFKLKGRLDIHFEDPVFQRMPMPVEIATFRIVLCEELWKQWITEIPKEKSMEALATFVIDQDRQITNIKVTASHLGKTKDQAQAQKFEETVRTALERCSIKEKLPNGIKKVRMQVNFIGS